jgi:hypothetical protein
VAKYLYLRVLLALTIWFVLLAVGAALGLLS